MQGLMMEMPLTITSIMRHARTYHATREIVSVTADNQRHRYTYADAFRRVAQLAHALEGLGLRPSDRIATLAWNDHRHFEIYYAVSCAGFVLHTINPRLFSEQITYIINHAEDQYLFVDPLVVPLVETIRERLATVKGFVVLSDDAHMPASSLPNVVSYESLLAEQPDTFDWPALAESEASSLCYTSGTTGEPKGVLYSHRSTVIHAYATALPDAMNLSARDALLPVVPMFHVNAWGTVYSAPHVGAKLILPGPKAGDPETLYDLMESEQATAALGVPTVWLGLLQYLAAHGKTLSSLERTVVGGSACPPAIIAEFRDKHDVVTHHAWGMTETSPLGTYNSGKPGIATLPEAEQRRIEATQGRAIFGIELGIFDDDDEPLPWDGQRFGALKVRGPWVASTYFRGGEQRIATGGWFDTGDVATIDADGFMQITDRTKDVIKSGGEWISSIELENLAVAHAAVAEAAVIGIEHPKWGERPLLLIVKKADRDVERDDILAAIRGKVADWWIPDAVEFVDELPHTATGKISKRQLREVFRTYEFESKG
jgi:fatty-acyl-CoA synthase